MLGLVQQCARVAFEGNAQRIATVAQLRLQSDFPRAVGAAAVNGGDIAAGEQFPQAGRAITAQQVQLAAGLCYFFAECLQAVVKPPATGPAQGAITGSGIIENVERQHVSGAACRRQSRQVGEAQVVAKKKNCGGHVVGSRCLFSTACRRGCRIMCWR